MNGQNLTKFCIHFIIDKIYIGIVNRHFFGKFATELRPLIIASNSVFVQYLENEWTEFNQILCVHFH